jgi:hypothetical protein
MLDPVSITTTRAQVRERVHDETQTFDLDLVGPCVCHGDQNTTIKPGAHSRLGYLKSPGGLRDWDPACVGNRIEPRRRILERGQRVGIGAHGNGSARILNRDESHRDLLCLTLRHALRIPVTFGNHQDFRKLRLCADGTDSIWCRI